MKAILPIFSTFVLGLSFACGAKHTSEAQPPVASAQHTPTTRPAPAPEPLVDAWYNDRDGDAIPDFVELELHHDPNIDQCIVDACGEAARSGRLVSTINTLVILDVSGSMGGKIAGKGTSKLELAKRAVARYVETMPAVDLMKVGLMVYGQEGDSTAASRAKSCQAFATLQALGPVDPAAMIAAMKPLKPAGWSPIAGALEASAAILPEEVNTMNHIILVADGIEACGGDAVAMARRLRDTNHLTVVDVVGLGVGAKEDATLLREIAAATGGTYQDAPTVAEFDQAFNTLNLGLWKTLDTWMCAVGSEPLAACYQQRANESIVRTEKEIEAMTRRGSDGEKYAADLWRIRHRTETMRDGRQRVVTTYKVKLDEIRKATQKQRPKD